MRTKPRLCCLVCACAAMLLVLQVGRTAAEESDAEQLKNEIEALKRQMKLLEEKIQKQERLIDKLAAEKAAPQKPAEAAAPAAVAPAGTAPAGAATEAVAPPAPEGESQQDKLASEVTERVMRNIRPSLAGANKTFPSQFNPAIGLIVDTAASYKENERANFEFRSAELGVSASVDPFARGYAILNGTNDGFEVEEAAIVTTSLPWNLTVKGGRFFADFGRLSKFHDHDLPFVNRPIVLDEYVGGESQADGVEVSWLAPTSQYLTLTLGAYNKMGADNDRADNDTPRNLTDFTYLGRAATFLNLSDANSVDLGASWAYTPKIPSEGGLNRQLVGVDLTYRYLPLSEAQYRGLIWGTEVLYNRENRIPPADEAASSPDQIVVPGLERGPAPQFVRTSALGMPQEQEDPASAEEPTFQRHGAWGLYSYVEARLSRRLYPGFLFDFAQDIDPGVGDTRAYSPYLTLWMSEFQRLRFQYTYLDAPMNHESEFFLQWTIVLGSHVHGFRDR